LCINRVKCDKRVKCNKEGTQDAAVNSQEETLMTMTEQQIQSVIAAQNGDVKSFEQLYTIYYAKVYGFARMILKN